MAHLGRIEVPDRPAGSVDAAPGDPVPGDRKVDLRGTVRLIRGVPGLLALIFIS